MFKKSSYPVCKIKWDEKLLQILFEILRGEAELGEINYNLLRIALRCNQATAWQLVAVLTSEGVNLSDTRAHCDSVRRDHRRRGRARRRRHLRRIGDHRPGRPGGRPQASRHVHRLHR